MSNTSRYPHAIILTDHPDISHEIDMATGFFNELITYMKKNKIPFDLDIQAGSIEFSLQIWIDLFRDPFVALVVAHAVGAVVTAVIEKKGSMRILNFNRPWDIARQLKEWLNKNPKMKLKKIVEIDSKVKITFEDMEGKIGDYTLAEKVSFEKGKTSNDLINSERTSKMAKDILMHAERLSDESIQQRLDRIDNDLDNLAEDTHERDADDPERMRNVEEDARLRKEEALLRFIQSMRREQSK